MASRKLTVKPGEAFTLGNRIYMVCPDCLALVRMNKPIFGALHLCPPECRQ